MWSVAQGILEMSVYNLQFDLLSAFLQYFKVKIAFFFFFTVQTTITDCSVYQICNFNKW